MTASNETAALLQRGVAAARAGRKEEASRLLMQVVEHDERNEQAWLWLSSVVDSPDDRRVCLENVLAINPNHSAALTGLRHLDQVAAAEARSRVPPAPSDAQTATRTTGQTSPAAGELCPFCHKPLPATGAKCPHCGGPLLVACPACGEYADVQQPSCATCGQSLGDYRRGAAYFLSLAQASLARGRTDRPCRHWVTPAVRRATTPRLWGDCRPGRTAWPARLGRTGCRAGSSLSAQSAAARSSEPIYQQQGQIRPAQAAMPKPPSCQRTPPSRSSCAPLPDDNGTVTEAVTLLNR